MVLPAVCSRDHMLASGVWCATTAVPLSQVCVLVCANQVHRSQCRLSNTPQCVLYLLMAKLGEGINLNTTSHKNSIYVFEMNQWLHHFIITYLKWNNDFWLAVNIILSNSERCLYTVHCIVYDIHTVPMYTTDAIKLHDCVRQGVYVNDKRQLKKVYVAESFCLFHSYYAICSHTHPLPPPFRVRIYVRTYTCVIY